MGLDGHQQLLVPHHHRFRALAVIHPQHLADTGAIDIGIEQTDTGTIRRQGQGQVNRCRGFADTALTPEATATIFFTPLSAISSLLRGA